MMHPTSVICEACGRIIPWEAALQVPVPAFNDGFWICENVVDCKKHWTEEQGSSRAN